MNITSCFRLCQAAGESIETTVYAIKLVTDNPLTQLVKGVIDRYGNFFSVYETLADTDGVNFFEERKVSQSDPMLSHPHQPQRGRIARLAINVLEMIKIIELIKFLPRHTSLKFLAPAISVVSGPSVAFALQVIDLLGSTLQVKTTVDDAIEDKDKSFFAKAQYSITVAGHGASAVGGAGLIASIFLPSPTSAVTAPVSTGIWIGGNVLLGIGTAIYVVRKREEIYGDLKKTVKKIVQFARLFFRQFYHAPFSQKVEFTAKVLGFSLTAAGGAALFVSLFVPPIGPIVVVPSLIALKAGGGFLLAGGILHIARKRHEIQEDIMKIVNKARNLAGLGKMQEPA